MVLLDDDNATAAAAADHGSCEESLGCRGNGFDEFDRDNHCADVDVARAEGARGDGGG